MQVIVYSISEEDTDPVLTERASDTSYDGNSSKPPRGRSLFDLVDIKTRNTVLRIGTWNITKMYQKGKIENTRNE